MPIHNRPLHHKQSKHNIGYPCLSNRNYLILIVVRYCRLYLWIDAAKTQKENLEFDISPDTSFSRSKYFNLLIAPIEGFINLIEQ